VVGLILTVLGFYCKEVLKMNQSRVIKPVCMVEGGGAVDVKVRLGSRSAKIVGGGRGSVEEEG